jgi:hypothetical protein
MRKYFLVITPMLRWNSTGETVAGIGAPAGISSNQLNHPVDVFVDSLNTLYIADTYNNRIQLWKYRASSRITIAGHANRSSGSNTTDLNQPGGIHIDSNGNLYIGDTQNNRIQLWTSGASSGVTFAGSVTNQLNDPYQVVYDENTKMLYVAGEGNHRIMSFTSGTLTGTVLAGGNGPGTNITQLMQPLRFYFDSVTNSFVIANFGAHNIVRWVLGATSWTLVAGGINGTYGSSSTLLFGPLGMTVDPMGNVYVADAFNARIQLFLAGQTTGITIAGINGSPGPNSTQISSLYSVQLDNQLKLYVVDTVNCRIQKYTRY